MITILRLWEFYSLCSSCLFLTENSNAPYLFTACWCVIKGWLDEATVKKIHILGISYKDKLLEMIDAENLPERYGGTCTCDGAGCGHTDVGPWNDRSVPGYPDVAWEFGIMRDGAAHSSPVVKKMAEDAGNN